MTLDIRFPLPRLIALAALAGLAACGQGPAKPPAQSNQAAATARPAAVDKFQALALEAGQGLVGTRAPNRSFKTLDGRRVRLGQPGAGRPVYLKFWATWCVTCREQMEAFKADYARYGKDIDVIAVDTGVNDDLAAVEAYRREVGLTMPMAIDDGRLGEALRLRVTPQHVIIGRDGTIRYVGHLEDERLHRELQAAIDEPGPKPALPSAATPAPAALATLASVQGAPVRIDGPDTGPPRLLYFLSPWCETYLKDSRPGVAQRCVATREALAKLAGARRVQVIGIASGLSSDAEGVRRYLRRTGFQAPIVLDADGALFRRFGVRSFPAVIRLDDRGRPAGPPLSEHQIEAIGR